MSSLMPPSLPHVTGRALRAARAGLGLSRPEAAALPVEPVHPKTLVLWERSRHLPRSPRLPAYVASLEAMGAKFTPEGVLIPTNVDAPPPP